MPQPGEAILSKHGKMAFAKASNQALTQKVGALLLSIHNIIASFFLCFLIGFAITKAVLDDCVTLFDNQNPNFFEKMAKTR